MQIPTNANRINKSFLGSVNNLGSCMSVDGRVQTITEEVVDIDNESHRLELSSPGAAFKDLLSQHGNPDQEKRGFRKFKRIGS